MWNKKHDEFTYQQRLMPSSCYMLRWMLRKAKPNEIVEIEIDLKKFNNWVAKKRRKPYDRATLALAIAQLDNQTEGMIVVLKRYTPWIFKILVRPLSFVENNKSQKTINQRKRIPVYLIN